MLKSNGAAGGWENLPTHLMVDKLQSDLENNKRDQT